MMEDLVVVGVDIPSQHAAFKEYYAKDYKRQIDILCERILQTCAELKIKHANANWLFSWREFGISNRGDKFLPKEAKAYLKQRLQEISAQYENVTIIAGPIATYKTTMKGDTKKKLAQAKKYLQQTETIVGENPSRFFSDQIEEAQEDDAKNINIFRNTTYIFHRGKCTHRHDKMTPDGADINKAKSYNIFQGGNKQNNTSVIQIGDRFIVVEICREHKFALAKKTAALVDIDPILQLILSEGTSLNRNSFCSKYVLQLDHLYEMQLIDTDVDTPSPVNMTCYCQNLFEQSNLNLPWKPISLDKANNVKPPFIEAVFAGDEDAIMKMKNKDPSVLTQHWNDLYPWEIAILNRDVKTFKFLLNEESVNMKNKQGATPLHLAISKNAPEILKVLLEKGADPNESFKGSSPLMLALNVSNNEEIKGLIIQAISTTPVKKLST